MGRLDGNERIRWAWHRQAAALAAEDDFLDRAQRADDDALDAALADMPEVPSEQGDAG